MEAVLIQIPELISVANIKHKKKKNSEKLTCLIIWNIMLKSGKTNLTWGNVNNENPLTSACMSSTIISKRESPKASMSISFLILQHTKAREQSGARARRI